jgi:hypothetical protein
MHTNMLALARMSVWLLLFAATLVASFWLMLVFASGFQIWTNDSNGAGLAFQTLLVTSPVALFVGLELSKNSSRRTVALFLIAWALALATLMFFDVF